jgi:hypothetical protein
VTGFAHSPLEKFAGPRLLSNEATTMFELDQFAADCRAALAAEKSHKHARDVVAPAVADTASILSALSEPNYAGQGPR